MINILSKESIAVALELLSLCKISPVEEDCERKWKQTRKAAREFQLYLAELEFDDSIEEHEDLCRQQT